MAAPTDPMDAAGLYRGVRARIAALLSAADPARLALPVPACPEWSALDVLAHLVGIAVDVPAGNLDGVASDAWTAAQVDARRGRDLAALLDELDDAGPRLEEVIPLAPRAAVGQMLFDAFEHEHDLRHALSDGAPTGAPDAALLTAAFDWLVAVPGRGRTEALVLDVETGPVTVGPGEPVARVALSRFEYVRAAGGRRSAAQVSAYGWEPPMDPEQLLAAPIFRLSPIDLIEPAH